MVCPCCVGCDACPSYCAFDLEISVDDTVGTHTQTLTHADCTDPCTDSIADQISIGDDFITINANYPGSGGVVGFGRVDELRSGGGVTYTRAVDVTAEIACDFGTKKWTVTLSLNGSDFQATDPFYSGIGFQKEQTLALQYSVSAELGCADDVSSVTIEADGSGVTINGTSYSWVVNTYTETCKELDGNQVYQDCTDYLAPDVPTVTFVFSRRAGC